MNLRKRKVSMIILTALIILFIVISMVALSFAVVGKVKDNKVMVAISLAVILVCVIIEVILGSLCNKKLFSKESVKTLEDVKKEQIESERRKDLFTEEKIETTKDIFKDDDNGGIDLDGTDL